MRRVVEKFVAYPVYANLIIAIVILSGVVSFTHLKKAFFPETESRFITVSVFYPGASPVDMEEGGTTRIPLFPRTGPEPWPCAWNWWPQKDMSWI